MAVKGWSALRNRAERAPGAQYIKLKSKEQATIHFLVQKEDDVVFFKQHYIDGKYLICEDETEDNSGDCKYCEASEKRPSDNYAFNVLDRGDGKVKILALNATHAQAILEFLDEYGSLITKDYKVKRTGDGSNTRYNFVPTRDVKKWDAVEKKAYEDRYDLEKLYDPETRNPKASEKTSAKKKISDETAKSTKSSVKEPKKKTAPADEPVEKKKKKA